MFSFPAIEPSRGVPIGHVDIPFGQWNSFRFDENSRQTFGGRLNDFVDDMRDSSPFIPADEANKRFGVQDLEGLPGSGLNFSSPIRHDTAYNRRVRKLQELEDMNVRELASHSWYDKKAVGSFFLGAIPGSMAHPLDFAVNFIPFIGQESKAAQASSLTRQFAGPATRLSAQLEGLDIAAGAISRRIGQGVIPFDTFKFGPLASSSLNAAIGNAVVEIPVAIQNFRDQRIYGIEDAVANIAVGGIAGGSLHLLGRGLSKAAAMWDALPPEARTRAVKTVLAQAMSGEEMNASHVVGTHPEAIKAEIRFDEAATRKEVEVAAKRIDEIDTQIKAAAAEGKAVTELSAERSALVDKYPGVETGKVGSVLREATAPEGVEFHELQSLLEKKGQSENGVRDVKFSRKDQSRLDELGQKYKDRLFETVNSNSDLVAGVDINGNQIFQSKQGTYYTVENGRARTGPSFDEKATETFLNQRAEAVFNDRVEKAVEFQKKQYNAPEMARQASAKATEVNKRLGRDLTDAEVKQFSPKEKPESADIEALHKEAKDLETQLAAELDAEGKPKELTAEEKGLIEEADKKVMDRGAVQAAIDCILRNGL